MSETTLAQANMHSSVIEEGIELVIDRLGRCKHGPTNQAMFNYGVALIFCSKISLFSVVYL